jgi:hypothetical protein
MRKVTRDICTAFIEGRPARSANTWTDGEVLFLHRQKIAWKDGNGYHFCLCGWNTPTTRDRLNGVFDLLNLPIRMYQHKHGLFIDGKSGMPVELSSRLIYSVSEFC